MPEPDFEDPRVCAAEDVLPPGIAFKDLAEIGDYLVALLREPWFRAKYPGAEVVLLYGDDLGAASGSAHNGVGWIRIGPTCRHEKAVLHEMAHVVNYLPGCGGHDKGFQDALVTLIFNRMGVEHSLALVRAYGNPKYQ